MEVQELQGWLEDLIDKLNVFLDSEDKQRHFFETVEAAYQDQVVIDWARAYYDLSCFLDEPTPPDTLTDEQKKLAAFYVLNEIGVAFQCPQERKSFWELLNSDVDLALLKQIGVAKTQYPLAIKTRLKDALGVVKMALSHLDSPSPTVTVNIQNNYNYVSHNHHQTQNNYTLVSCNQPTLNNDSSVNRQDNSPSGEEKPNTPPPRIEKAYQSYCWAERESGLTTDKEVFSYLKENPLDGYDLPAFDAWQSYVSRGRAFYNTHKNTPRAGRSARAPKAKNDPGLLNQISNQHIKT